MNIFAFLFIHPITNVLVALYKLLTLINAPFALGFSIILLTIFIRLILYPFISSQIKASYKMQRINPHLASLKEKHKGDKKRLQEETMKLYKEHGINPAAGCLPMIIQLPIIWSLYNVLTQIVSFNSINVINEKINNVLYFPFLRIDRVWDTSFFGLSLSNTPAKLFSTHPAIILVPFLTGFFQFLLSKMMMPEVQNKPKKDDFQSAFQTQSLYIFPLMIGFFSFSLPIGLSLYWNTFTIFGILQQYLLVGTGGLKPYIEKLKK